MNESNKPAKEMETLGEAALRLLGRLNERAKKKPGAGDAPTNFEIDRARNGPCPSVDGGPAAGGSRLALSWGRDRLNMVPSRSEGFSANDNAQPVSGLEGSVVPKDQAGEPTFQGFRK